MQRTDTYDDNGSQAAQPAYSLSDLPWLPEGIKKCGSTLQYEASRSNEKSPLCAASSPYIPYTTCSIRQTNSKIYLWLEWIR